uniref:Uncharacterized protein n=1 Tax=Panagrolaimus sp. ES5 TaxID=591445 RepID=A0AC34FX69_9BILA
MMSSTERQMWQANTLQLNKKLGVAKKEAENLQCALNAEKDSMNARIAVIEQQKNAEIESLKAAVGDSEAMEKELVHGEDAVRQHNDAINNDQVFHLNEQYLKANAQVEEYKSKVKSAQQEAENLQCALNAATGESELYKNRAKRYQKEVRNLQAIVPNGKEMQPKPRPRTSSLSK